MDSSRNSLLDALKQVERRTENSASGWRLLFYWTLLVPAGLALFSYYFNPFHSPITTPAIAIHALPLISTLLLALSLLYVRRTRQRTQHQLTENSMAIRIAAGELKDDGLLEATPWPWKRIIPGQGESPPIAELIRRVAWNLDWYVKPRQRLWRWNWILLPTVLTLWLVQVLLVLVMGSLAVVNVLSIGTTWPALVSGYLESMVGAPLNSMLFMSDHVHLLYLLPFTFLYFRRQIWTEELVRHLRERLEA